MTCQAGKLGGRGSHRIGKLHLQVDGGAIAPGQRRGNAIWRGPRGHSWNIPVTEREDTMGSFDRRDSRKMRRRAAQAAKKERAKRQAAVTRQARATAKPAKKKSSRATATQ
jgi:hypothetical protein